MMSGQSCRFFPICVQTLCINHCLMEHYVAMDVQKIIVDVQGTWDSSGEDKKSKAEQDLRCQMWTC